VFIRSASTLFSTAPDAGASGSRNVSRENCAIRNVSARARPIPDTIVAMLWPASDMRMGRYWAAVSTVPYTARYSASRSS